MTKQATNPSSSDVQAKACAGAPVITAKMIEEGLTQFLREYPETGTGDVLDRKMVENIFRSMTQASITAS